MVPIKTHKLPAELGLASGGLFIFRLLCLQAIGHLSAKAYAFVSGRPTFARFPGHLGQFSVALRGAATKFGRRLAITAAKSSDRPSEALDPIAGPFSRHTLILVICRVCPAGSSCRHRRCT